MNDGILGKQHGMIVTPFRLFIFKVFFIHGEILENIYQFYFLRALMCARCLRIKAGSSGSQKTVGSYNSWFLVFTRQRFFNQVYKMEGKKFKCKEDPRSY